MTTGWFDSLPQVTVSSLFPRLNAQQLAIVEHEPKDILVVQAGAGCGKTTSALLPRAAHLFNTSPGLISVLTFGKDISKEMELKARQMLPANVVGNMNFFTSHSLAWKLIREHFTLLGMGRPQTLTDLAAIRVFTETRAKEDANSPNPTSGFCPAFANWREEHFKLAWAITDLASARGVQIQQLLHEFSSEAVMSVPAPTGMERSALFRRFAEWSARTRRQHSVVMLRDMLPWSLELPDIAFASQGFRHLLVDEAQDLSDQQHQFVARFLPYAESATMVGDYAQCIFRFAGSRPDVFAGIATRYAPRPTAVREMTTNYRSTNEILAAANAVLAHPDLNSPIRLQSASGVEGEPAIRLPHSTPTEIVRWLMEFSLSRGFTLKDFAFLARTNAALVPVEMALRIQGFPVNPLGDRNGESHPALSSLFAPFVLVRGSFEGHAVSMRKAWNTLIASQRFLGNQFANLTWQPDLRHLLSVQPAGQKGNKIALLSAIQGLLRVVQAKLENNDIPGAVEVTSAWFIKRWESAYASDPEMRDSYLEAAQGFALSLRQSSMDDIDLLIDNGVTVEPDPEGVVLGTIHKAKGAEYPVVVLLDVGGSLPSRRDHADPAEEASIFYVGVTRPKKLLVLADADDSHEALPYGLVAACPEGHLIARPGMNSLCTSCPHQFTCVTALKP